MSEVSLLRSPPKGEVLERGLRSCPRMAKMAAEVCRSARGANSPKLRTAC